MSLPDFDRLAAVQAEIAKRPTQDIVDVLLGFCQTWVARDSPLRARATEILQACTGLSPAMIGWGLESTFGAWIGTEVDEASAIRTLLTNELGNPAALGAWVPTYRPGIEERYVPARLTLQILAGNIFAATIHQLLAGCLARTAQILKPATGQVPFVELLVETLANIDPELAAAIAIVPFETSDSPTALAARAEIYRHAEVITITGSDATIAQVTEEATPAGGEGPLIHAFGHRVSAAYLARWYVDHPDFRADALHRLALDISAYDQSGCLSPLIVFVEDVTPADLLPIAEELQQALRAWTAELQLGIRSDSELTARKIHLDGQRLIGPVFDGGTVAVTLDPTDRPALSPGGRVITLAPVGFPAGILEKLQPYHAHLGSLGVALHPAIDLKGFRQASGLFPRRRGKSLIGHGFNRLCTLGQMQTPTIGELHDGRPRLSLYLRREERTIG